VQAWHRVPRCRNEILVSRPPPKPGWLTDAEAIAAITRTTNGNFRVLARLFAQIQRVLEINRLHTITAEVVDAARETLVIGQPWRQPPDGHQAIKKSRPTTA
jgi:hypothetical protein